MKKVTKLTVKKTTKSRLINIWSNKRALSLFCIQNLNTFRFWKKDFQYMGCGKIHIKFLDPDDGIAQGFVLGENNNGKLLVETRNRVSLIVSPPMLEKYTDDETDKERFRWDFKEEEYNNMRFIVVQYHPIQMNITKYNNLTYLTYVVPRCVYRRVSAEETEMEESLCS